MMSDVPYVKGGHPEDQVMDIYLPLGGNSSVTKVILFIHGGAWFTGNKESLLEYVTEFQKKEEFFTYAMFNMNYRLATEESIFYPKQIEDVKTAIKFITDNQSMYKIKPKFALVAESAGTHLSLLYGYMIDKSVQVKVICNFVGPTNVSDKAFKQTAEYLVGEKNIHNEAAYRKVSPVTYVTSQSPKTISIYGGMDTLVPARQGEMLKTKLDHAKVVNEYHLYPKEGHLFEEEAMKNVVVKVASFFKKIKF